MRTLRQTRPCGMAMHHGQQPEQLMVGIAGCSQRCAARCEQDADAPWAIRYKREVCIRASVHVRGALFGHSAIASAIDSRPA